MLKWLMLCAHVPAGGAGGGMIRYAVELSRALQEHPDVELHVLSSTAASSWWVEELGDGGRVHPIADTPVPVRSLVERQGWAGGLRGTYDVVHGTKHLVPRRVPAGTTRLLTVHDMLPLDRPGDFGRAKRLLLRGPYLDSVRDADAIVTVSAATAERLCSYVPAAAARIHVTPLATSPRLLGAAPEPVASLAGRRFVLIVGDQSARKNLRLVIAAWPQVLDQDPSAVLAIAGPQGWARTLQGGRLDAMVAAGSIQLLGHISDGQLRWAYESCCALAFPSLLEGFGLPAVEARALGAPLVISEDPALNEAAMGYGQTVPSDRPREWARALAGALAAGRGVADPRAALGWTWADTARATVAAVLDSRPGRGAPGQPAAAVLATVAAGAGAGNG